MVLAKLVLHFWQEVLNEVMKEAGYTRESLLVLDDFIKVHVNTRNFYIFVTYNSKSYRIGENKK